RSRFGASLPAPPPFHLRMRKKEGRGRPRANHIQGGNLRAAWRPLAAYFAAVRRALAPAVGPRTCCSRFFLIRSRRGHGTHASAKDWDSNAVLCGTWQIPAANTRAPSLLSWPTRRGKESGSKLSASALLRLGLPQCPAAASGPRQARTRKGPADRGRPRFAAGLRVADHLSGGAPNAPEQRWQASRPTVMRLPAGRP